MDGIQVVWLIHLEDNGITNGDYFVPEPKMDALVPFRN